MDFRGTKGVIGAVFAALLATGCGSAGAISSGGACGIFKPISWSAAKDSRPTVRQIKGHNAAGKAACDWKGKA